MTNRRHKYVAWLLVLLFAVFYGESTLFVHTHSYEWGTVTHSHPFMPSSSHQHTQNECQAIDMLSAFVVDSLPELPVIACLLTAISVVFAGLSLGYRNHRTASVTLRGPPAMG